MKYLTKWEPDGLITIFKGRLNINDLRNAVAQFQADERFENAKYSIWDVTAADMSDILQKDMLALVAVDYGAGKTLPEHKLGVVATDPHAINLNNYYIEKSVACGSTWDVKIFDTQTAANKWIN
jgi:hypothetical protein